MTAGIGDVAELAGVSVATVSRALRGLPNVAPSTRQPVLEAADALGYVADPAAARLATGYTLTVGVAVTQLGQRFTAQVRSSVEAVVTRAGYDLLVLTVVDAADRQQLAASSGPRGESTASLPWTSPSTSANSADWPAPACPRCWWASAPGTCPVWASTTSRRLARPPNTCLHSATAASA